MKTILFQGDSITDADRNYHDDSKRGLGYPQLVTASLGYDNPGEYSFINRGISGNRIVDVYARIKKDIINLKPDIMSILIGVNDVWHEYNPKHNGVATAKFEKIYSMLIEEIKEELESYGFESWTEAQRYMILAEENNIAPNPEVEVKKETQWKEDFGIRCLDRRLVPAQG